MRFLVPLFTLLLPLIAYTGQDTKPYGKLQSEQKFQDYTVRIYRNEQPPPSTDHDPNHRDGLGCFEILKSGKQVHFQSGIIFRVERVGEDQTALIFGRTITGDKQPYLVISDSTGAHCCIDYYIFLVSDSFRLVQKVATTIGGEFKDMGRDGELELVVYDSAFEYWHVSGAASPHPPITLRYQSDQFRPDLESMRKTALSRQELEKLAHEFKSKFAEATKSNLDEKWTAPSGLWGKMLELIYSGNEGAAWKLCDLSWPEDHPNKAAFLKDFNAQLLQPPGL
jgi:hypothetical protein